ncbi:hypothetical protein CC80DRAFT_1957 [Byssothecium circinans]|uniref:Oxidoreductase-like protein n=1 Tax=Byssothecium circinans TaxID=147558 RepID=A0A6A5UEF5_9PLEO|nr:hypothetical protein CC80DRAFT_1957 [Byssothecium circinans]
MSVPPIEAKSLSSLTALASNPPSYPRNPTHEKHEPLVLYIARVPGSRDVFLSPMKPREKVVTAEDIQNSLYYIHADHPEDERFMVNATSFREPNCSNQPPVPPAHSQAPQIQRKAVPNAPGGGLPRRKPVPGMLAPVDGFENRHNVAAADYTRSSLDHLRPDYTPRRSFDSVQRQNENARPSLPARGRTEQPHASSASLTLIRRDPASGVQWNIAHIEDPPTLDVASSTLVSAPANRPIGAPLYIDITNPGYSKFLHAAPEKLPPSQAQSHDELFLNPNDTALGPQTQAPSSYEERSPSTFHRRLWMEGARDPSGGFGHRRLNSYDSNTSSARSSIEGMQRSSADLRPAAVSYLSRENQSYSTIQVSEKQTSFRGYVFMSPWNGRCEFSTGAGGGSLKCRHIVPGLQGAPPVSLPVSELRFNLPATSKASTPRSEESSKRTSFFHRPRHNRHSSSVSDTHDDSTHDARGAFERLDLTLGQEYAGGGFGGKESKLGKLIIEDEGLKMVDLLVAANVALWWRVYNKYDTRVKTNRVNF